eukprot:GFYU01001183.1.p1 GENE.GFYU01001183.1~~GFYU01001183.1.p1  ORF type:complete len:253 (-),score=28.54 GFYU01001183.1:141-899(-)
MYSSDDSRSVSPPSDSEEFECSLCYSIFLDPVRTTCGHVFCRTCIRRCLFQREACPLCRDDLTGFNPDTARVDHHLATETEARFGAELMQRRREEERRLNSMLTLRFKYGNRHKAVSTRSRNTHKWTAYLELVTASLGHAGETSQDPSSYIERVDFHLHPTFSPPTVSVTEAPFKLTRLGWGTFEVDIEVHFKSFVRRESLSFSHHLSFEADDSSRVVTEEIQVANVSRLREQLGRTRPVPQSRNSVGSLRV